jgi:membrane protein
MDDKIGRLTNFFQEGMWTLRLDRARLGPRVLVRTLRIVALAAQGFLRNGCAKSAAYLTYYSLLNIVPLLAVAFAISKGFGLEKLVENRIIQLAQDAHWQTEATNQLLKFSQSLLQQAKGGIIAGVGVILLFYTVVSILEKIEETLNTTWNVRKARTFARKIGDYLTLMMLAPILFITSSSITIFVASKLKNLIRDYAVLGPFSSVILFSMKVFSYLSIWVLLMVLYVLMPNTRVKPRSAFVGGIVGGSAYLIVQWAYVKFQIGISSYGAIYGSFAALPLLLVWLQWSWMIVLFGAETAHAYEYHETYGFHPNYSRMGSTDKKTLVVGVFHAIVQAFSGPERALTALQISRRLEVPLNIIQQLISELIDAGLVTWIDRPGSKVPFFQPARATEDMTIKDVLDSYEALGKTSHVPGSGQSERIAECLKSIEQSASLSAGNLKLKDL